MAKQQRYMEFKTVLRQLLLDKYGSISKFREANPHYSYAHLAQTLSPTRSVTAMRLEKLANDIGYKLSFVPIESAT